MGLTTLLNLFNSFSVVMTIFNNLSIDLLIFNCTDTVVIVLKKYWNFNVY